MAWSARPDKWRGRAATRAGTAAGRWLDPVARRQPSSSDLVTERWHQDGRFIWFDSYVIVSIYSQFVSLVHES